MRQFTTCKMEKEVIEEKLSMIICNKCGKEIQIGAPEEDSFEDIVAQAQIVSVAHSWGYGSKFDLEHHQFDLCEDCYEEIIGEFKIPVKVEEYIVG